jgi:hypothetical protein
MFVASLGGATHNELACRWGLSVKRVQAILLSERHKRDVSPTQAYNELRKATGFGVRFGILPS